MRPRAAIWAKPAVEETRLEMAQCPIWLAYTLDEAQGRNLGQARHGGDPFGNGPMSYLARLYIRLELARATRALVLSIRDPLTLRRAVIRRAIATSPTQKSTCANVHNMGRSKCCEC